jgi:hypothetical protein
MPSSPLSPEDQRELDFVLEEVRRLHTSWDAFEQLSFAPGRTALLRDAGHLLHVTNIALATEMVLTVSRLCDPVGSGVRLNLVFRKFATTHPALGARMSADADELFKLYESDIKPIRDKRLGHNDLSVLRGTATVQSPTVKALRRSIELCTEIVAAIASELDGVAINFTRSNVPFEIDWIEAALRLVAADPVIIKPFHEAVRSERFPDGY